MTKPTADWYKRIWSLEIEDMSWTESTNQQVDFIIAFLALQGNERILDLACGYGRHANELARRGFSVTGVDITPQYIERATSDAKREALDSSFICEDIRDVSFHSEFDVVLNMADGAIGYLETDQENAKVFDRIAESLRPNGKHLMDICNAEHAERYFPTKGWDVGRTSLSLSQFDWDPIERRMLYGGWEMKFGTIAERPKAIDAGSSIRLYSVEELHDIMSARGMQIIATGSNYTTELASSKNMQMEVYSRKTI